MAMSVLEALHIFYQRRELNESSHGFDTAKKAWLDPSAPLTREELEQVAEAVYALMRQELRTERERQRGF